MTANKTANMAQGVAADASSESLIDCRFVCVT
jgi:hypothetical protein